MNTNESGGMCPKFAASVTNLGQGRGLEVRQQLDRMSISSPVVGDVVLQIESGGSGLAIGYFTFRTTSWHYDGERTDLHDCLSLFFALMGVGLGRAVQLWDVKNEFSEIEEELYARLATVSQPELYVFPQDHLGIVSVTELIKLLNVFVEFLRAYVASSTGAPSYSWQTKDARALKTKLSAELACPTDAIVTVERRRPDWLYVQIFKLGISALRSNIWQPMLLPFISTAQAASHELKADVFRYQKQSELRFCHAEKDVNDLMRLSFLSPQEWKIVTTESHLFAWSGDWLIAKKGRYGLDRFRSERQIFADSLRDKLDFLFEHRPFVWNPKGCAGRFEDLCRELLLREPTVRRVWNVSPTNQPDDGRDLIAEIAFLEPGERTLIDGERPVHIRTFVVQSKLTSKTLGVPKPPGPYEVLYLGDYDGYFLITNSRLSSTFTKLLEKLRRDERFTADWWTREDLEDRLRNNSDLLIKYSDLVAYGSEQDSTRSTVARRLPSD